MQTIWVKNNQKFGTMLFRLFDEFGTHHFKETYRFIRQLRIAIGLIPI